jgi:hypothetical protein
VNRNKIIPDPFYKIIAAIYPFTLILAITSLYQPWVSGRLLVVGKTMTGSGFPNVFWSVLLGSAACLAIYVSGIIAHNLSSRRPILLILSFITLIVAGYFLNSYSQASGFPGVRISLHGGVLLTYSSLTLAVLLAAVPWQAPSKTRQPAASDTSLTAAEDSKPIQ